MLESYIVHPNNTVQNIFTNTVLLIVQEGVFNLSMRKIASASEMSLSNVQYYFKTKELLLAEILEVFLTNYVASLKQDLSLKQPAKDPQIMLQQILIYIFDRADIDDCLKLFKEVWLLSEHNQEIHRIMANYYETLFVIMVELLEEATAKQYSSHKMRQVSSLLMPYLEGYYLTRQFIPFTPDELAKMLSKLVMTILVED